ncbi:MAG: hypothetical protein WKG07_47445 [Hymenobacter sp.]
MWPGTGRAVARLPSPRAQPDGHTWREGRVSRSATEQAITQALPPPGPRCRWSRRASWVGTADGRTTTLGREGSDYSAAIFAYCLRAESVTIWKDVPGLLNADPKLFADTVLYPEISYQETDGDGVLRGQRHSPQDPEAAGRARHSAAGDARFWTRPRRARSSTTASTRRWCRLLFAKAGRACFRLRARISRLFRRRTWR